MMNLFQLFSMLRQGGNPKQMAMQMLQNAAGNNPMAQNVLNMAQSGDAKGIENFARNICAGKNVNFEQAFAQFRRNSGL